MKQEKNWLFGYGSPVTLGVFRILLSTWALVNFAMIAIDFDSWFTERGYVPWSLADRWNGDVFRIDLLAGVTNPNITAFFYGLVMVAALLTALGLFNRVSSIVLALGVITIHHRNPIILHGGDTLLRMCVIYIAVAPSGVACSLDRLIGLWKQRVPKALPMVSLWPQRIIQIQVAIVYFTTVYHKWGGSHWRDGTAAWYPTQLTEFNRFPVPAFFDKQPFIMLGTYGTLLVELSLATLVFYKPLRKWVLLAGILMHGYIEYRFNIPLFAFVICSTYVAFYEGEEISEWARRMGQRLKGLRLRVELPTSKRLASGAGDALQAADALSLIEYLPGEGAEIRALTPNGGSISPVQGTLKRSIGAWPVFFLWKRIWADAFEDAPPERKAVKQKSEHAAVVQ